MEKGSSINQYAFIAEHGLDAEVAFPNGMRMPLSEALEAEEKFCPPSANKARLDPDQRVRYLAKILSAGGSLHADYNYLLESQE